jgi:uncharacterized protein
MSSMPVSSTRKVQILPARSGVAIRLSEGQTIEIINVHGTQVVDTWALAAADLNCCLSMEHIRTRLQRITISVGDALISNHRTPMLTVVADTSAGVHDTLIAACDKYRYAEVGLPRPRQLYALVC